MDLSAMLVPGVQNFVTAVLGDAWTATRDLLARRLSRGRSEAGSVVAAVDAVDADAHADGIAQELERIRSQCLAAFPDGEPDRRFMEGFWYCYLSGMLHEHPDLAAILAEVREEAARATPTVSNVSIENSGTFGRVVQNVGDVSGGIVMN